MDFVLLLFEFDRRSLSMAYFFLGVAFSTFAADERRRLSPAASDLAVSWIWAVGPAPSLSAVALLGADGVLPARLSYEHPGLPHRVSRSAVYLGFVRHLVVHSHTGRGWLEVRSARVAVLVPRASPSSVSCPPAVLTYRRLPLPVVPPMLDYMYSYIF